MLSALLVQEGASSRTDCLILSNPQVQQPPTSQILDALVDGTLGKITVNPPSGGWKAGKGFRVNLVADTEHLSSILAQSPQFDIVESTSSTFSSSTGSATSGTGTL